MKKATLLSFVFLTIFFGCKKSGDSPSNNQPTYIGKWTFVNSVTWYTVNGRLYKDTTLAHTGEYVELKSDGTLTECSYVSGDLKYETFNYQVIDGKLYCTEFPSITKVIVSGNTMTFDASEPSNVESIWWHFKK